MPTFEERIEGLKQRLDASRQALNTVLDAVNERWEVPVYSDGAAWNVRELLIHLSIAEAGVFTNIQRIINGEPGVPDDFDIDRYNQRSVEKRADTSPEDARTSLAESRQQLLSWLDTLSDPAVLVKSGRHPAGQIFTIEEMIKIIALHERDHAKDIAHALDNYESA